MSENPEVTILGKGVTLARLQSPNAQPNANRTVILLARRALSLEIGAVLTVHVRLY